tara:strand:- start:1384 stop:2700 length:1317 start_codon:yes stop_codon:yes gene_type:complete
MAIRFEKGGFLGHISASGGNIFIDTSGSVGTINLGTQLEITGSKIIEKDKDGNKRVVKTFNADGSITREEFSPSNQNYAQNTYLKDGSGTETIQSASSDSNQIQFQQTANGALIIVSGSGLPGILIAGTSNSPTNTGYYTRKDVAKGTVYSTNAASPPTVSTGIDSTGNYYIDTNGVSPISTAPWDTRFKMTPKGDISMSGDLTVTGKLTAEEFHTTYTSSSIVYSSGSTAFGDSTDDTHIFTGSLSGEKHLTIAGDISASGNLLLKQGASTGGFIVLNQMVGFSGGFPQDDYISYSSVNDGITIKSNHIILDASAELGIGNDSPPEKLTVEGNISSSGATIHKIHQFADGDTTPSVSNKTIFKTANSTSTTITGLDDGVPGQIVHILIQDNNTDFTDGTNFNLFRSLDWTAAATNDVLSMICVDGTKWVTLQRTDNS